MEQRPIISFSLIWSFWCTSSDFFAAFVICKKNYSFSRVVFLFFSVQNCQLFFSKKNESSEVRTTRFWSDTSGFESLVPNVVIISLTFIRICNGSHGTVGRTTGFWSCRYGFETLSCQIFLWLLWHLSEIPMGLIAVWVKQQGSEAAGTDSNPSLCLLLLI